jgi:HPt (histidine-containing phosphotransfer) domain-containing protein/CheY-like chemotaxis protein
MNTLRVLVVNTDPEQAERLAGRLEHAQYMALPAAGLEEAAEALFVQKFDAVLLGCPLASESIAAFTAKLRALERSQRSATPAPVLSISSDLPDGTDWQPGGQGIDGYVPDTFEPATLVDAIHRLASAIARRPDAPQNGSAHVPILNVEGFREQIGHDDDLMRELIDLFLSESPSQVLEMREALATENFERLGRAAHTMKGSFAAFHAEQARTHAQELETASKAADSAQCREMLCVLEHDLELLKPELLALRNGSHRA